jgi:hypothetical protein
MNRIAHALGSFRLTFLALTLLLSGFAMLPPATAHASSCGSWQYFGCCVSSGRVSEKLERICCDDNGNCTNQYTCTGTACPV